MKTNSVPAVVMLSAGFIDCALSIYQRLSLFDFTRRLLLVLVVFYILGCAVKLVLDINFAKKDDPPEEETAEGTDQVEETATGRMGAPDEELENIDAQESGE